MDAYNVYAAGVGGQGIGLLSEVLVRAGDHAGLTVKSVDTHGLAQRGGIVVSHLRFGENAYSPLISKNSAHLVVALERHEALRGLMEFMRKEGNLVYYDTVWQPLGVRLNQAAEVENSRIQEVCERKKANVHKVMLKNLEDARMQNIAVLACIAENKLLPSIGSHHIKAAMEDLMTGTMLKKNLTLFNDLLGKTNIHISDG